MKTPIFYILGLLLLICFSTSCEIDQTKREMQDELARILFFSHISADESISLKKQKPKKDKPSVGFLSFSLLSLLPLESSFSKRIEEARTNSKQTKIQSIRIEFDSVPMLMPATVPGKDQNENK